MRNYTPTTQPFYGVKTMIQESGPVGPTGPTGPTGSGTGGGTGATSLDELTDASFITTDLDSDLYYKMYIGEKAPETLDSNVNVLAIGKNTMQLNTNGNNNVSLGHHSLSLNTEGSQNTAIGIFALQNNIDGDRNVAVGYQCMEQNITGSFNTAMGRRTLENLKSGDGNTVLGYRALQYMEYGNNNTFIGTSTNTGYDSELGMERQLDRAIAIGYQAVASITGGLFFPGTNSNLDSEIGYSLAEVPAGNTRPVIYNLETGQMGPISSTGSIGNLSSLSDAKNLLYAGEGTFSQVLNIGATVSDTQQAGDYDTSSLKLLAIGYDALRNNTTGTHNIAIGGDALRGNTVGVNNIAVGVRTLDTCAGDNNIGMGNNSLANIYEGSNNVAIGNSSLSTLEYSNNNTAIGTLTSINPGVSDAIAIGNKATASITGGVFFPGSNYGGVPLAPVAAENPLPLGYDPVSGQLGTRPIIHTRYTSLSSPPEGSVTAATDIANPLTLPGGTFSIFVIEDDGAVDPVTYYFRVPSGQRAELLILNKDLSAAGQTIVIAKYDNSEPVMIKTVPSEYCCYCNIVGDLIAYMDAQPHALG